MAERVFDIIQMGVQSTDATPVAATAIFPARIDSAELDRSLRIPEEDFGRLSPANPGRLAYGPRGASASLEANVRFEDVMRLLEMHGKGGVAPTGSGPYTWTYTFDETSLTAKSYTLELGSETAQDQWRLIGCRIEELTLGFDALAAPGNAPWSASASIVAIDRTINALTSGLSAPAALETAEGHLTTVYEGTTATAFSSLTELAAHLVAFRLTSRMPWERRIYGSTSDTASSWGLSGKPETTFEMELKVSSSAKTNIHDTFMAAGAAATERRLRIRATGSGTKTLTIDGRVVYESVQRGDRNGEAVYSVTGRYVYDPTLASRLQIVVVNGVSAL
jgi:hypothetical protein